MANGTYAVTVTMGDFSHLHDNMVVKANGTTVLSGVSTAAGGFAVNTFNVTITGGSLSLQFSDAGGTDPTWVVNGVSISSVSPPPSSCDRAQFIADVTVPDGTIFNPGTTFSKTWRLKNVGTCTWTTSYMLVFDSGDQMGGPGSVNLPMTVTPGQTVDITINLTAPSAGGSYRGYWKFQNASGIRFGIGADGTKSWWVDIDVAGPTATPGTSTPVTPGPSPTPVAGVMYDFAANACSAVWLSGAVQLPNQLPCPGTDGDQRGFVLKLTNPQLENGTVSSGLGLLTYPQNIFNGYIQGIYPSYTVKPGDRFRSIVNCAYGATTCYVVFRLDYQTGTGSITTFWAFVEKYEGQYYQADLDLSPLVGKDVKFILTVLSTGSPVGDRALWVSPMIYNPSNVTTTPTTPTATSNPGVTNTPAPTVTPTATGTATSNWNTYQDVKYNFSFKFPPGSSVASQSDNAGRVFLPFTAGTNLVEKYIDVSVVEGASTCKSPHSQGGATSANVTINGTSFLQETGSDGAAGNFYDWVGYSTVSGNACISLTFVLHSIDPGVYPTMPPTYDKAAESAVFSTIMSTFGWLSSASTGSYAVVGISANDVLNIRSGAGVTNPVVSSFAYNANNVTRTGASSVVNSAEWWQVQQPGGGTGWVNSFYLTEYVPTGTFCADSRVSTLLTNLGTALKNSDGAAFAALVSPKHGVDMRLANGDNPVNFSQTGVNSIFSSSSTYNWGAAPGSGQNVNGTFKDVMLPKLVEVYNSSYQLTCNDTSKVGSISGPWPNSYTSINFYSVYKPATPGVDLDWRDFLVGIEYVNGQPYLFSLINFQWEP